MHLHGYALEARWASPMRGTDDQVAWKVLRHLESVYGLQNPTLKVQFPSGMTHALSNPHPGVDWLDARWRLADLDPLLAQLKGSALYSWRTELVAGGSGLERFSFYTESEHFSGKHAPVLQANLERVEKFDLRSRGQATRESLEFIGALAAAGATSIVVRWWCDDYYSEQRPSPINGVPMDIEEGKVKSATGPEGLLESLVPFVFYADVPSAVEHLQALRTHAGRILRNGERHGAKVDKDDFGLVGALAALPPIRPTGESPALIARLQQAAAAAGYSMTQTPPHAMTFELQLGAGTKWGDLPPAQECKKHLGLLPGLAAAMPEPKRAKAPAKKGAALRR